MPSDPDPQEVAAALRLSIGLFVRRLRQIRAEGELSLPEASALARLERGGSTTAAALARLEQISPQSMGSTLAALESRGLVRRAPDPHDGRRVLLSLSEEGFQVLRERRGERVAQMARALSDGFTAAELRQLMALAPLIERLAQSL